MFGISWAELLVIMIVALIILGPERLPKAAETLGRVYGQLYRAWLEARKAVEAEADLASLKPEADWQTLGDKGSAPAGRRGPKAPSGDDSI